MSAVTPGAAADRPVYTFRLDVPPSVNGYLKRGKRSMYQSAEARAFKESAGYEALSQGAKVLTGKVVIVVTVYKNGRYDLDNRLKVLFDALNGVTWEDDDQIVEIHAYKHRVTGKPYVEVSVWQQ